MLNTCSPQAGSGGCVLVAFLKIRLFVVRLQMQRQEGWKGAELGCDLSGSPSFSQSHHWELSGSTLALHWPSWWLCAVLPSAAVPGQLLPSVPVSLEQAQIRQRLVEQPRTPRLGLVASSRRGALPQCGGAPPCPCAARGACMI